MSNIKKLRKLKIQWKILLSAMLVIFVFGGYMVFAKADSSVTVSVTTTATIVNQGTESNSIVATMSGRDENNVSQDSPDNYKPAVRNLKWTVSNSDIIKFVVSDSAGTKYADTAEGTANPTIYGNRAGKATITATYYTKAYGPDGSITYEEELGNDSVDIIVPLKINSFKAYRNGVELTKEEMLCYQVGDIIEITSNANDTNKIFVETDNDKTGSLSKDGIVEKVSSSGAKVTLKIVGGGRTNLKVRTADGDGINSLTATYQITSKVEYTDGVANSEGHSIQKLSDGTRFITLSDKDFEDFKEEAIPSNIKYPATAGVTYVSSDTDVITYKAGSVKGVNAGVAQATAGVASIDVQGNIGWATKDAVNVVVPFKKLGNDVSNMNVGDSIQLKTSAKSTEVTWSTSDNSVLQVDATTGLVTAMGAGKATIYATRVDDELSTKYKLNNQLSYEITVIDGFGLSLTSMSVNIGDTQNLVALVTNNPSKDDITFTVENQPDAAGVVPTETLINVVQSEDGRTFKVTGIASGIAHIKVTQNVNGVIKKATCVVYVTTPVGEITINPSSLTVDRGSSDTVQLIFNPSAPTNNKVLWSSSNTDVATVEGDSYTATITGVSGGTTTITVITEDGLKVATCDVYVREPVTGLVLNATTVESSMAVGQYQLVATVLPAGEGVDRAVTWTSSDPSVATVDENGLVEAVGTGSCTILCKSLDGNYTAMCNIYVKQPVTQVILNTTDITVRQGQVFWLNATCLPENADNKIISWESRDESVCTVESDGKVTAVGAGTTSIIATNVDTGLTAYCVVTVTQPVTGISLNSDYQELWVGAKYAIIPVVEPYDAENKNVTYLSSDPSVATVDENGVVTALKGGSCIIEVTTEVNKLTAACTIVVKEYVSSITLSETDKFMNVGSTGTLVASVGTDTATNKNIVWSSSNYDICYVDGNGNLSANSVGNAVITATAADGSGVSASCIVKVVDPVIGITVEPDTVRLLVGDSAKVTAVITPDSATVKDVSWTSSNEAIATVDESGEIFALSTGKCKITATSQDGNEVKGVCWVYVTPVVNISSLRINSKEIYMLSGRARQLSVIVRPVNNTDSYEWYSTDTGIVQVDQNGVITTVGPGTADVFVISNNSSVEASCTVHSLAMSTSRVRLEQYDRFNLDVIGTEDAVTWRSSNPRVCTVSSSGEVIGRRAGTATVTATVHNKTLSCTVTVTNIR